MIGRGREEEEEEEKEEEREERERERGMCVLKNRSLNNKTTAIFRI